MTATPTIGSSMKMYSKLLLAFLLLILVVPQVVVAKPPKNGPHVQYWGNGKKWTEKHYKNGKQEGLWTAWHENGKKKQETHYKNGKEISRKEF